MLWIIYGLLTYWIFAFHSIIMKSFSRTLTPRESVSIHFFFLPLGIISILWSYYFFPEAISSDINMFFLLSCLFAIWVAINMLLWFYIFQKLNLSGSFKIKYGLMLWLALIFDFFFYNTFPGIISLLWSILFIISGFLLIKREKNQTSSPFTRYHFFAILIIAFFTILNRFFLKEITLITTNDILSIYITQTIIQLTVFLCWYKFLPKVIKDPSLRKNIIFYTLVIYIWVIFEFYLHRFASIFIISVVSNIKFFIFLFVDHKNKELHFHKQQIIGILLWLIGIWILIFGEYSH